MTGEVASVFMERGEVGDDFCFIISSVYIKKIL